MSLQTRPSVTIAPALSMNDQLDSSFRNDCDVVKAGSAQQKAQYYRRHRSRLVTTVIRIRTKSPMIVVRNRSSSWKFYMTTQHEFCCRVLVNRDYQRWTLKHKPSSLSYRTSCSVRTVHWSARLSYLASRPAEGQTQSSCAGRSVSENSSRFTNLSIPVRSLSHLVPAALS